MKKLQEAKEHFKNADLVLATNSTQQFNLNIDLLDIDENGYINEYLDGKLKITNGSYHCVFDGENYAKIITNK